MRTNHHYDAASIAAQCSIQDLFAAAAHEQWIQEARSTRRHPAPIAAVGHLLVRLGQWLQMTAHHPTYQEETVQW